MYRVGTATSTPSSTYQAELLRQSFDACSTLPTRYNAALHF